MFLPLQLRYKRGPAVAVLASTTISNSSFDRNELCCGAGSYREDTEEVKRNGRCVPARPVAVFCLRPCSLVRHNTYLLIIVRIVNASRLVDQPWDSPGLRLHVFRLPSKMRRFFGVNFEPSVEIMNVNAFSGLVVAVVIGNFVLSPVELGLGPVYEMSKCPLFHPAIFPFEI